ncbi:hypothetical protein JCM3765_007612 [Sporobolomyces pararoseus]
MSQSPPAKRARLSSQACGEKTLAESVLEDIFQDSEEEEQEQNSAISTPHAASGAAGTAASQAGNGPEPADEQVAEGGAAGEASAENRPTPARSPTPEPTPRQKARIEKDERIDDLILDVWRFFEKLNSEGVAIAAWIVERPKNPSASAALEARKRAERSSVSTCYSSSSETIPTVNVNSYISNTIASLEGLTHHAESEVPARFSTGSKRFELVFDAAAKSLRWAEFTDTCS